LARIHGDILIERPPEVVFDFVADERNEPSFNPQMATSSLESGEPIGEGSRFRTTFRSVGRLAPMTVELTGYERPVRLASRSSTPGMQTEGELTFEPEGKGTRMRWSWDVQVRGPLRLADPLVARVGDRQEHRVWGNLKALLEDEEPDAAGHPGARRSVRRARASAARSRGRTPPFRGPMGEVVPGSIAEAAYRRLGGLDQWVMIRGRDAANPPLIFLHGGPGWSETWLFRRFNAPLEDSFPAVYWDQRGAGRSYDRTLSRSSMTVEQLISDLDELVDQVCERLGKPRVAILGHSWGSALGVLYAARFPKKVAAYIGSGQIGDWPAAEAASYELALAEAERLGHRRAAGRLRAIGPPPYGADAVFTERIWSLRLSGGMSPRTLWGIGRTVLGGKESSLFELPRAWRGFHFTMNAMWPEISRLDLIDLVPALEMPIFFLLGRKDPWVPPRTSVAYFDALRAPAKELVWFERSGHEPFVDEPDKFNVTMTDLVRPALLPGTTAPRP
jgi:pimeloyl-ACP methyl ester carboxylesterase